jgi:hypothetical protein
MTEQRLFFPTSGWVGFYKDNLPPQNDPNSYPTNRYTCDLNKKPMYTDVDSIRKEGFSGFRTIAQLWEDYSVIPNQQGIYVIIQPSEDHPIFLEEGVGGFHKGRNPNVAIDKLSSRWVPGCKILYFGKAGGSSLNATLRSRLQQYLEFGKGKPQGHYGGRLIWQLKHHPELVVAWKALPDAEPRLEEARLIEAVRSHYGRLPFANLKASG